MLTIFGIRTDMDLRSPTDNMLGMHPLGANVSHIYYRTGGYASIFEESQKEPIRQVFSDLAKEYCEPKARQLSFWLVFPPNLSSDKAFVHFFCNLFSCL